MIAVVPIGAALLLAGSAASCLNAPSRRSARDRAVLAAALGVALTALGFLLESRHVGAGARDNSWMPDGWLTVAPVVTALVALLAVALAPTQRHEPSSFATVLLLSGCGEAFLATTHPLVLAVLWVVSAAIAWWEIRRKDEACARVFALYHGASGLAFGAGAMALWQDVGLAWAVPLLMVGIAIRESVMPVHSWFPMFAERSPMAVVIAFVGPQLGVYAHLELLSSRGLGPAGVVMASVGAVTALLAAMLGVVQRSARRALAFLIASQTGLVAFGLENHSPVGLSGALLSWQVLALATSGFAMALAGIQARRGQQVLTVPSGNFAETPRLGVAFLVVGFASVGFPLTAGFIAEDLLVQGSAEEFPLLAMSLVVTTAFNGLTVLRTFFYLFTGSRRYTGAPDLTRRESGVFAVILVALLLFGAVPSPIVPFQREAHTASRVHDAATASATPPEH